MNKYKCEQLENEIKQFISIQITKALKTQEQHHEKVTDFLIESHAFDISELKQAHKEKLEEEYKKGFNDCLKEQKLTGERWQNLYL